jgi:hypothetical protein
MSTPDSRGDGSQAWMGKEDSEFEQLEQDTQADADRETVRASRPDRWRPFRREGHNEAVDRYQTDEMEIGFEKGVESEIDSGEITPAPGGPLTPEEIHQVEMNPWPGHTMEEAVARLRAQEGSDPSAPSAETA